MEDFLEWRWSFEGFGRMSGLPVRVLGSWRNVFAACKVLGVLEECLGWFYGLGVLEECLRWLLGFGGLGSMSAQAVRFGGAWKNVGAGCQGCGA